MNTNLNAVFFIVILLISGYLMHRGEGFAAGLVFSMGCIFICLYSMEADNKS